MVNKIILPTTQNLKNTYEKLQTPKKHISEQEFASWVAWVRLDPRLCEIMIKYISYNYTLMNPFLLKKELSLEVKAVFAVLCEVAENLVDPASKKDWRLWKKIVQNDVEKVPFQSFYLGTSTIKPSKSLEKIKRNLNYFSKWGFYCSESPISLKYKNQNKTLISQAQRKQVLEELMSKKKEITVNDYIDALNKNIHRRQAERDLSDHKGLRKIGFTRTRIYKVV